MAIAVRSLPGRHRAKGGGRRQHSPLPAAAGRVATVALLATAGSASTPRPRVTKRVSTVPASGRGSPTAAGEGRFGGGGTAKRTNQPGDPSADRTFQPRTSSRTGAAAGTPRPTAGRCTTGAHPGHGGTARTVGDLAATSQWAHVRAGAGPTTVPLGKACSRCRCCGRPSGHRPGPTPPARVARLLALRHRHRRLRRRRRRHAPPSSRSPRPKRARRPPRTRDGGRPNARLLWRRRMPRPRPRDTTRKSVAGAAAMRRNQEWKRQPAASVRGGGRRTHWEARPSLAAHVSWIWPSRAWCGQIGRATSAVVLTAFHWSRRSWRPRLQSVMNQSRFLSNHIWSHAFNYQLLGANYNYTNRQISPPQHDGGSPPTTRGTKTCHGAAGPLPSSIASHDGALPLPPLLLHASYS